MRRTRSPFVLTAVLAAALAAAESASAQGAPAPPPALGWTPKAPAVYTGPHKPLTKLADVLASHRGQRSWRQEVVNDRHMVGAWIQSAPGEVTKTMMLADNRFAMIVWDGEVRVTIEGQEPFVARKGFIVQVPYRVPFKLETVGDRPSLRFETYPQMSAILYPEAETPPSAPAGVTWYKARLSGRDTYERQQAANAPWQSRPYFDFFGNLELATGPTRSVVKDDRMVFNIIRGKGVPRPPDTNRGHFHLEYAEFWLIAEGTVGYLIEGQGYLEGQPGDIVYVPPGLFHRAGLTGNGMSTRMPINAYPGGSHHYQPDQ